MKYLGLLLLLGCALASQVRYDNFKVYRVVPKNEEQIKALRNLEEFHTAYSFWIGVSSIGVPVDVMVPPHMILDFEDFLKLTNMEGNVFIQNVQEKIDGEKSVQQPRAYGWTSYYELDQIYAWLDEIAEQYPDKVKVIIGGESYEGRQIKGVHVSFSSANENKAVFIEGGIHAREWITPAVVTYMLNEVLTSTDSSVREIVESYDWYVFPNVNPDGYVYTHTNNRLWRKTRVPYSSGCYGADPNRNWAYEWMNGGASNNPCQETYAGPNAFSEPCTKTLSEFITSIHDKIAAYLAFHSYSQLLLIPYGHTSAHLDNYDELMDVGGRAIEALAERYGTKYTVGNIVEAIYVASGGSMDWVKGNYKTRVTYTWELRDQGKDGFLLPAEQIIPTGEETFDSVLVILKEFNSK